MKRETRLGDRLPLFPLWLLVAVGAILLVTTGNLASQGPAADPRGLIKRVEDLERDLERLRRTAPPIGSVAAFAGHWPPKDPGTNQPLSEAQMGWALCDGRPLDDPRLAEARDDLKELAAVLGVDRLPDYKGSFLRGLDRGIDGKPSVPGRDPDAGRALGSPQGWTTGMPRNAFSTGAAGHFSFDDRVITGPNIDDAKLNRWPPFGRGVAGQTPALSDFRAPARNSLSVSQPDHTHSIGGGDAETRPINVAVHWIIKFR